MPHSFQTLQNTVTISGVALHCGLDVCVTLRPSTTPGFVFRRVDLPRAPKVAARLENVIATHHATVLQSGEASVSTTEHLLAALYGLGITGCEIELDGPELPILDGSAQPWVEAIESAGRKELGDERPQWRLQKPVWFEGVDGAQILGLPLKNDDFRVSVAVSYQHPHLAPQNFDGLITPESFATLIAPARTFTLEAWLEPLRALGLIRGGSLENAVVFFEDGPSSPPRMENELATHKALDLVGDFALMLSENALAGHLIAIRAGHGAHRGWMQKALAENAFKTAENRRK